MKKLALMIALTAGAVSVLSGCSKQALQRMNDNMRQQQLQQHRAQESRYRYEYDHNRRNSGEENRHYGTEDLADLMYQDEGWVRHELSLRGFRETDSGYFVNQYGQTFFIVFDSGKCVDIKGV